MRNLLVLLFTVVSFGCFGQASMNVSLIYNWTGSGLAPSSAHDNTYNEIWGYEQAGREYAIMGSSGGTHIIDITDTGSEAEVDYIPGEVQGPSIVHRDYHTYNNYLYAVCDEGPSSLQIIDLSYLPDSAHVVYDSDALFSRSHNIFIDTTSAKMYVCGGALQMEVYSIADPLNPVRLLNCQTDVPFWGQVGYVHDVYVENDIAYCNAGNPGLYVVDFSDVNDVLLLGALTLYPQNGYNHSGWLMDNGTHYCLADENFGFDLKILDVTDLSDIQVVDTIDSGVHPLSIPHNPIYHENLLHVAYYNDGYQVWNCDDPAAPVLVGYYDTSTEPHITNNYRGAWGVYPFLSSGKILISDMQEGLFVLDVSGITGIEDDLGDASAVLHSFPNPVTDQVNLVIPESFQDASSVQLFDLQGKLVLQIPISQRGGNNLISLDLSGLESGIYAAVVSNGSSVISTKITKR